MKDKIREIMWKTVHPTSMYGVVGDKVMFIMDEVGKKNPKYVLKSYPFRSDIFTKANVTKKLGTFNTVEEAKAFATEKLKEFVSLFIEE